MYAEGLSDSRWRQVWVADRGQIHKPDPVGKSLAQIGGQSQPGLANAAGAGQSQQAHLAGEELLPGYRHFLGAPNERR